MEPDPPDDADLARLLLGEMSAEAERSFVLADALDFRVSIWLVVVTFLAAQTGYFLHGAGLSPMARHGQLASAVLIGLAGIAILIELYPRKYAVFEPSNGALEERLAQLRDHYAGFADAERLVTLQILRDQTQWAKERSHSNNGTNRMKSHLLLWIFWLTVAAAALNLATLLSFVFRVPS